MTAGTDRDGVCPQGRAGRGTTVVAPGAAGVVGPRRSTAGLTPHGAPGARRAPARRPTRVPRAPGAPWPGPPPGPPGAPPPPAPAGPTTVVPRPARP